VWGERWTTREERRMEKENGRYKSALDRRLIKGKMMLTLPMPWVFLTYTTRDEILFLLT